jgi:predicted methyltransferase
MKRLDLATLRVAALLIGAVALPVLAAASASIPAYVAAAVANPARPPEDVARDAARKPAEVLTFAGVKPGATVLELIPGKGYFTRLLSGVVGPKGHVGEVTPQLAGAPDVRATSNGGTGLQSVDALHRIDEAFVKREVESAGFRLVGESKVLRNPADNHTLRVFDPAIRGHTDQFLLRFKKPG